MPPLSDHARETARRSGIAAAVIALLAWCLAVVGALVRAHGAGLACPDWPLCFGEVIPTFDLKVAFEWGHRAMAGVLTIALVALSAFLLRDRDLRARFARPIAAILAILGVQIVLGGLTVLLGLAPWTVTAHLLTGNAFVISLAWLSHGLIEAAKPLTAARSALPGAVEKLAIVCAVLVFAQLLLGGLVASHYAGLACETFPLCNSDSLAPTFSGLIGLQVLHRLNAYAVCAAFALLAFFARGSVRIGRRANFALAIVLLQVGVGVANVLLKLPIEVTALHSLLATATALASADLVREVVAARTSVGSRDSAAAQSGSALGAAR